MSWKIDSEETIPENMVVFDLHKPPQKKNKNKKKHTKYFQDAVQIFRRQRTLNRHCNNVTMKQRKKN